MCSIILSLIIDSIILHIIYYTHWSVVVWLLLSPFLKIAVTVACFHLYSNFPFFGVFWKAIANGLSKTEYDSLMIHERKNWTNWTFDEEGRDEATRWRFDPFPVSLRNRHFLVSA